MHEGRGASQQQQQQCQATLARDMQQSAVRAGVKSNMSLAEGVLTEFQQRGLFSELPSRLSTDEGALHSRLATAHAELAREREESSELRAQLRVATEALAELERLHGLLLQSQLVSAGGLSVHQQPDVGCGRVRELRGEAQVTLPRLRRTTVALQARANLVLAGFGGAL